jgi:hypothetical protein
VLGTKTNVGAYAPWWQYRNMAIKALGLILFYLSVYKLSLRTAETHLFGEPAAGEGILTSL